MEEIDLVSKDTVADLIKQKFESPLPKCQDDDDPFVKVIKCQCQCQCDQYQDEEGPHYDFVKNIARIANAVQCHS